LGYFDDKMGQPPSSLSPEFLEIDAEAGPWLEQSQQGSPIDLSQYPNYELDLQEGVIWFGNDERKGAVAGIQLLGTYTAKDQTWLWASANPKSEEAFTAALAKLQEDLAEVPEFAAPTCPASEAKAWALAAAAAYKMESQTCFRLPDEVTLFVALFDINVIGPDDPRAVRATTDPELAMKALEDYAGPAMLQLGAQLAQTVEQQEPVLDPVIAMMHEVAKNLDDLERSPVGQGSKAADEAGRLAAVIREAVPLLSVPPNSPALVEGVREVFVLFKDVAQQYGAWPQDEEEGEADA
jgi:Family of unknown function (DUF6882)